MRYNYFFEKTHNRKFQALAKFLKLLYLFGFVILITWFSFALRRLGYTWEDYTGFQGRTLWEVLDLLIVPITATVLAFVLGRWEKTREERITKQSQSNAALLKYYEIFSKYMIEYDMLNKDPAYTLRISLTNITKSIFSVLDHSSKRILIFFLLI